MSWAGVRCDGHQDSPCVSPCGVVVNEMGQVDGLTDMNAQAQATQVIIVGAGPAGLATGGSLRQHGVASIILEAGATPGTTWRSLYDRLHLHTIKRLSSLPGFPMGRDFPRYASREQVVDYLERYAKHFDLAIATNARATKAVREGDRWVVTSAAGVYSAPTLVSATGIFSNPEVIRYPGQERFGGRVEYAHTYQNPAPYLGQRVLVVGSGNTGVEIAIDLAEHGVATTVSIRAGANVVPLELLGVPIQVWAHVIAGLPQPVSRVIAPVMLAQSARRQARAGVPRPTEPVIGRPGVPIIGLDFLRLVKNGVIKVAPGVDHFTDTTVCFKDGQAGAFDVVIYAVGYRPALAYLSDAIPLDDTGRPRLEGVRSLDAPNLYFVGMHVDIRGTLFLISKEAPQVAAAVVAKGGPISVA